MFLKPIWLDIKSSVRRDTRTNRPQNNLWLVFLQFLDEKIFFPLRFQRLKETLSPHLQAGSTVLDIGSSSGRLARRLADRVGCDIVGVDVCIQLDSYISVCHYDGLYLPFDNNTFECVMMVDMLHHVEDIEGVIAEARRVSSRYLLIKDHYWKNRFTFFALLVSDYIGNAPYGVLLPYNFQRLEAWQSIFESQNLEVVTCQTWKYYPLDICDQVVFNLQKPETAE